MLFVLKYVETIFFSKQNKASLCFPIQRHYFKKQVRKLQETLETIKYDIGSKRKSAAIDGAKNSKKFLSGKQAEKIAASCNSPKVCIDIMKDIDSTLDPLTNAVKDSQDAFTGSLEERDALDKAYDEQVKAVDLLTKLEENMVPEDYVTPVPSEYDDLPQLTKRATVEMVLKKGEAGAQFDINGVNFPQAKMKMVIDGYTGTRMLFRACSFHTTIIQYFIPVVIVCLDMK